MDSELQTRQLLDRVQSIESVLRNLSEDLSGIRSGLSSIQTTSNSHQSSSIDGAIRLLSEISRSIGQLRDETTQNGERIPRRVQEVTGPATTAAVAPVLRALDDIRSRIDAMEAKVSFVASNHVAITSELRGLQSRCTESSASAAAVLEKLDGMCSANAMRESGPPPSKLEKHSTSAVCMPQAALPSQAAQLMDEDNVETTCFDDDWCD